MQKKKSNTTKRWKQSQWGSTTEPCGTSDKARDVGEKTRKPRKITQVHVCVWLQVFATNRFLSSRRGRSGGGLARHGTLKQYEDHALFKEKGEDSTTYSDPANVAKKLSCSSHQCAHICLPQRTEIAAIFAIAMPIADPRNRSDFRDKREQCCIAI